MIISFTGHRDYDQERFAQPLRDSIRGLVEQGATVFWSGMAVGFDLAAAEAVLELRDAGAAVELNCAIPYSGQSQSFSAEDCARYDRVLSRADRVVTLAESYSVEVYTRRNDFLVERADRMVADYDGEGKSGTAYTSRKARRKGIMVENIYPQQQLSLF